MGKSSGVPRISEWEGSRCRRRRGGGEWGGGITLGEGSGERVVPENSSYFFLKIPYFDAFWHVYFLNNTPMGGVLIP